MTIASLLRVMSCQHSSALVLDDGDNIGLHELARLGERPHLDQRARRRLCHADRGGMRGRSGGFKRRSYDIHMVFGKKRLDPLFVCTREVLKEPFQPPWRDDAQQHAGLWADMLEGMHRIFRDEDKRPGGCALDAVAELEVKFPAQRIEELILRSVDVHGRTIPRGTRVSP